MSPEHTSDSGRQKIAVIGGGIAGLTAAYRLAGHGHQVVILEQSEQLGGLAAAFPVPGGHLEYFYHHLFMSDQAITELIDELGIGDHLAWLDSQNSYYSNGEVYSLASPMDLLKLPVVPFLDRIRIGLVTLYLQRITTESGRWKKFERVTAWEWLRRAVGKRAFDATLGGQLRAKFGPRAEEVAMVWFWNKIYLRTQSRPGLLGKEQLGYIIGSFNVLIDRLAEACRDRDVAVLASTGAALIQSVGEDPPSFAVTDTAGTRHDVDAVVVTTPAPVLGKLFPEIDEPYRSKLKSTVYQGAVCMLLRLNRPLTDTYWLNIVDERLPFTVIVEHTNFIGPEHYNGNHYVYVNKYLDWDHRYATMPEGEVIEEYYSYLPLLNPQFDRSWVEDAWLFRTPTAQPVVGLFYPERIPEHRTPIAGVYLASMSQIYPEDRGTNYAVDLGNRVAGMVAEDLAARRSPAKQSG